MDTILALLPNSVRFYGEFLSGIRRRMESTHQLQVVDKKTSRHTLHELLKYWTPIGCIVDGAEGIGELEPDAFGETPVVYRDRSPFTKGEFLDVTQDYIANGKDAARTLIRPETKHYVYVGFSSRTNWSVKRGDGFASVIELNGKHIHRFELERPPVARRKELTQWLAAIPKPFAAFAANDATAKEVLLACQQIDVHIPDDVQLLGIDNKADICENVSPRMSSISTDFEKSGWICADLLYESIANPSLKSAVRHYPTLGVIHRDSTFVVNDQDARIIPALKFIRSRACDGITVEDVAHALNRPRRTAELWFRQATGKTIKETITETRMERAKILLKGQGLSMKSLAAACGYASDTALRIAFKNHYGVSMLKMRQSS